MRTSDLTTQTSTHASLQAKSIPAILGGKDALIKSQTGSGKTLAYALPIVHRLQEMRSPPLARTDGVFAVVVVPTRELAMQVSWGCCWSNIVKVGFKAEIYL